MRSGIVVRSCSVALIALSLTGCQSTSAGLTEADRSRMRADTDNFVKAQLAGDWAAIGSAYTEDAMLLPPDGPAVQGRTAIQEWIAAMPKSTALTCTILEIDGYGDLAYARGTCEQSMIPPGGSDPVKMSAKFLDIRRRQSDGRWLVSRDMFSFERPASQ